MAFLLRNLALAPLIATLVSLAPAHSAPENQSLPPGPTLAPSAVPPFARDPQIASQTAAQGSQVSLNGRTWPAAWSQWAGASPGSLRTGISDAGVRHVLGVELLSTGDATKQPVYWFGISPAPAILPVRLTGPYRYLDITDLAAQAGWQVAVSGDTLRITTPVARVKDIQQVEIPQPLTSYIERIRTAGQAKPAPSFRIVVDLDRPAPWQANFSRTVTPPPPPAPVKPPEVPNPNLAPPAPAGPPDDESKPQGSGTGSQIAPQSAPSEKPDDESKPQGSGTGSQIAPQNSLFRGAGSEKPDDESKPVRNKQVKFDEWLIALDGLTEPALAQRFNPPAAAGVGNGGSPVGNGEKEQLAPTDLCPAPTPQCPVANFVRVEQAGNQTNIRVAVPAGWRPRVSTLSNPSRLEIDIRPDSMVAKDILWAQGLRWRQRYLNLGADRFPVVWLEVDLRQPGIRLKPLRREVTNQMGIEPLIETASQLRASAAINGGFFNRNNHLPLGAIRLDGRWLSSPILNRGAIAWDDAGNVKIGRLSLQEIVSTGTGQRLPVLLLNSAYVAEGIARYTGEWGASYTPLSDNETIVSVQDNQVTGQVLGGEAGKGAFPIPPMGYLLVFRKVPADALPTGTRVSVDSATVPAEFASFPHILGAGPVLLGAATGGAATKGGPSAAGLRGQIVLDAKGEGFSEAFNQQTASRSAIGVTPAGTLLIVAVHNRAGGAGATLPELAQLMQQLGAADALNLDGGSSTGLYLGGQLLDRPPRTAAPVHNGLGVFLDFGQ
ncbi:phosphodiester glycosidase family protein [Kamptonema formosum]|uniref:phosphodiester glycosidase family protein n=1 Tax=Kamptonema formosum TaxID=331992 RepID=UPI000381D169|nr:phosphodiester glycosidase family protein [Oscillatoria sp. PCC 10802]